ncbi:MAG: PP2C family protein-serine/threonine phosphatase [Planctomycetota bacterium]|jgi:sigma-B regulation protein RsbU (phosphoserine phosphatase)
MAKLVDLWDRTESTWQERLDYIVETMREMSRKTNPHEMVAAYTLRMRALNLGRMLSLTRRGVEPPKFILARDSRWGTQPNPWRQREDLPVLEGGLLGQMAYGNKVWYLPDLHVDADDPHVDRLRGFRSLFAVPVFDGGEALNVMVFLRKPPDAFDPETLPQMVWMTNLFGRATHNLVLSDEVKRAYEALDRELKLIADIQRSLLPPELPEIPHLDLAAYYRPTTRAGGDYYDFFPLRDGSWGILIADVSGHGSPAAVEMAITRTLTHVAAQTETEPEQILAFLNRNLVARGSAARGAFVTAFCGAYDPETRELRCSCAGHHPPRLRRCSDGSLFGLGGSGGPPLGVVAGQRFEVARHRLVVGDQIIFYTDGITEAFNRDREMFGLDRLDRTLENCSLDAGALIDTVLDELNRFTNGREVADDLTLLVARVTAD